METDWLLFVLIIIVACGVKHNRNDIDEVKRQINKLKEYKKGGER